MLKSSAHPSVLTEIDQITITYPHLSRDVVINGHPVTTFIVGGNIKFVNGDKAIEIIQTNLINYLASCYSKDGLIRSNFWAAISFRSGSRGIDKLLCFLQSLEPSLNQAECKKMKQIDFKEMISQLIRNFVIENGLMRFIFKILLSEEEGRFQSTLTNILVKSGKGLMLSKKLSDLDDLRFILNRLYSKPKKEIEMLPMGDSSSFRPQH